MSEAETPDVGELQRQLAVYSTREKKLANSIVALIKMDTLGSAKFRLHVSPECYAEVELHGTFDRRRIETLALMLRTAAVGWKVEPGAESLSQTLKDLLETFKA